MGPLFLIAALAFGSGLVAWLPLTLHRVEALALATVTGLLLGTWMLLGGAALLGYDAGFTVAIALLAAGGVALLAFRRRHRLRVDRAILASAGGRVAWLAVTIVSGAGLLWLLHTHMLEPRADGMYTGGSSWGDLALHLTLASGFATEPSVDLGLPIVAGNRLTYPFLVDFLSGSLMRLGTGAPRAFFLPGALLALAAVQLLFFLAARIFQRAAAGAVTVVLFLLNGGLGGIGPFAEDLAARTGSLADFFTKMPRQYAHVAEENLRFSNVVCDTLLPQRGFLFGFPVLVGALLLVLHGGARRGFLLAGLLVGLLPFVHVHSFFVGLALLGWLAFLETARRRTPVHGHALALLVAALAGAPQVAWQLAGTHGDFVRFHVGWMNRSGDSLIMFWLRNLGLGALFLPLGAVIAWRERARAPFLWKLFVPLLVLFVLCNLFLFQPHDYDNLKFLLYAHLALCLVAARMIVWLADRRWSGKVTAACLVTGLTAVGLLSVVREGFASTLFIARRDEELGARMAKVLPVTARVLTSDAHNHVIPMVTGRDIVMGYRGWLWTHGIDFRRMLGDVERMYRLELGAERAFCRYGVTHVFVGPGERRDWKVNEPVYQLTYPVVFDEGGFTLYDVRTPRCPKHRAAGGGAS